jgi:IS30 family transposase
MQQDTFHAFTGVAMGQKRGPYKPLKPAQKEQVWQQWRGGASAVQIGLSVGAARRSVQLFLAEHGGLTPQPRTRATRALRLAEREEISRGLARGDSIRTIARRLERPASTISREIRRHEGRATYRALDADAAAWRSAQRPKRCKLATAPRLRALVVAQLRADWSPEQIAAWLKSRFPDNPTMHVSHETIYKTLYLQARGALKQELTNHLRRKRRLRQARTATRKGHGRGQIVDAVSISDRPATVEDRAVPGHWEGDLLLGGTRSQIATLVERHSRYVLLARLPGRDTTSVVQALTRRIRTLPTNLKRSLTWDRGLELASHKQFTVATDVQVYFCDPHSPWQRGSNENTNGLLRQYFPKGMNLSELTQRQLDAIALKLNTRPRQTLNWQTPAQVFAAAVASTG